MFRQFARARAVLPLPSAFFGRPFASQAAYRGKRGWVNTAAERARARDEMRKNVATEERASPTLQPTAVRDSCAARVSQKPPNTSISPVSQESLIAFLGRGSI